MAKYDVSFIVPCLNEELTIRDTIREIKNVIKKNKLNAEIIIVNNNSTDNSLNIIKKEKVSYINVIDRGYGIALREGIKHSSGKYIIMGDGDTTYNFNESIKMIDLLRNGTLFVIGNRYSNGLFKSNINIIHYYGGKLISLFGNICFKTNINDYNCGLRGINGDFIRKIDFNCNGMEFATEMIYEISRLTKKIIEVPVHLRICKYKKRKAKLNIFRDSFRHISYIIKRVFDK